MCASPKAATEADAPDADRVGPDAPAPLPDWLLRILVQIVCCLIKAWLALHPRGTHAQRSRLADRPSPSPVSGQSANDSISTPLDETIARVCQEQGVSPEDAARAKMARQITALINRMRSPDSDPSPQPESEPHEVSADTMATSNAAAPATSSESPRRVADTRWRARQPGPACDTRVLVPVPTRRMFARAGTGPPTGPPAVSDCLLCLT